MSFDAIIGQQRAKAILAKAIEQDHIHHSYLFAGPEGTGKESFAIDFAKALFCTGQDNKPCYTCSACRRVRAFNHPDFVCIVPHPKSASVEEIRKIFDSLVQEPYRRKTFWAAPTIGIDEIRELRVKCSIKPTEQKRVIALLQAEQMTLEAAKSLLKLLEEPPEATYFVLTTSQPNSLLPTILSRCQQVKFHLLRDEEVEAALRTTKGLDADTARLVSRICQGNYKRALEWVEHDLAQRRALAIDMVRNCLRDNKTKLKFIEKLQEDYDKQSIKDMLNLMLIFFRDALVLSNRDNNDEHRVVNIDQLEPLEKFTKAFRQFDYDEIFKEIEWAIELIDRNVHLSLILVVLFNKIQKIIGCKG